VGWLEVLKPYYPHYRRATGNHIRKLPGNRAQVAGDFARVLRRCLKQVISSTYSWPRGNCYLSIHMPPSRTQRPQRRPGARPINKSKWKECRSRLQKYRAAVQLDVEPVPTSLESSDPFHGTSHSDQALSAASKTTSRDRSESSFGTSYTNYTAVFSVINGSPQHEPEKRGLDAVSRARKSLTRYLKACEDCRSRKVKVSGMYIET
jgi:hypothetical protein